MMRMTIKEVSNNYAIPRSYNAIVTRIFTVHSVIFWICIIYVAVSPCFPVYSIPMYSISLECNGGRFHASATYLEWLHVL